MRKRYLRGRLISLDRLMRMLAKNPRARWLWSQIKGINGVKYFSEDYGNWTVAQKMFAHWCIFYDSIYESVNRPPDRIIWDDEKLEIWLENEKREVETYGEKNWAKVGALHDIKSAWDYDEVVTFGEE